MKKQYLVMGLGSFGQSVALALEGMGCDVIAVDSSMERVQEVADRVSYSMCLDVSQPGVMDAIGAKNIDGALICISDNLEASIMAAMAAKDMNVPFVMAKVKTEKQERVLKRIGVDETVFPEKEMGAKIAKTIAQANFADWIEVSSNYSMVEREVPVAWIGRSVLELNIRSKYGINIVGIKRDGKMRVDINPNEQLRENERLVLVGSNSSLREFQKL